MVFYAQTYCSYISGRRFEKLCTWSMLYATFSTFFSRHITVVCSHIHMALLCLFWESKTFRTIACLSKLWIQSLSSFQFCFSCCRFIHLVIFFVICVCCLPISTSCCCVFVCVFLSPVRALSGIIHACGIWIVRAGPSITLSVCRMSKVGRHQGCWEVRGLWAFLC